MPPHLAPPELDLNTVAGWGDPLFWHNLSAVDWHLLLEREEFSCQRFQRFNY
ncbi:hypothetical protein [Microcoleus sp. FACHB-68]|uniref:hypothetical protein n=1 Tax=Microcoleus sp. FACHB-68 TaxID=2692826 RepID=UPI001688C6A6|nr:hypothetical protein [Microcoleus sp. FACHB-68]MBD1936811.1 hypothetical protein [Microcoleus sp. FACHB-68]